MLNLIKFFNKIKGLIGNRIYILLVLVMVAGLTEGIGITLFLPIMQNGFGDDKLSKLLQIFFNFFHITFSFSLLLAFILGFFILKAAFLISYARYLGKVMADLTIDLRNRMFQNIFKAEYLYLLKKETGFINNAIVREIALVVEAFRTFSTLSSYAIYAVIYTLLAMLLNLKITLIIMIFMPIVSFFVRKLNLLTTQTSVESSFSYGSFHSVLTQILSKLKYFKSTFLYNRISKILDNKGKRVGYLEYKLFFLQALTRNAFEPLIILVVVVLFFYQVVVLKKNTSEVIFLIFLFLQVTRQFLSAQSSYRKFLAASGSIETFNRLDAELKENREVLNTNGINPDFGKAIFFKDVTILFPNGKKALDGVSINIQPKSVVAFVGHSGSGKSTIANMITGILKPTSGEIFFGDTNYNALNLKSLRESIGYVTQEDVIFNASIGENISLWDENVDGDKLAKVIEMAHIRGFVNDLPDRENSMLGNNGLDISGGQRQRITIARELYKNAKLLILDEATSSLDSKSERQIYENLKEFKGKKTMVVIAHRLSTIKNADYIYVIEDGRVVEEGTYKELYGRKGEFTNMVKEQTLT